MLVDEDLIKILVCPLTGLSLFYDKDSNMLVNENHSYGYPLKKGIPILLREMAIELNSVNLT